jgi:hypothetical protein
LVPNGAGKTNVLRAVTFVARALTKPFPLTDLSHYAHDISKQFTVELGISLSDEEKRALREHLILSLVCSYQDLTTISRASRILDRTELLFQNLKGEIAGYAGKHVYSGSEGGVFSHIPYKGGR